MSTTKNELSKNSYVLTEYDDFFKLENNNIVELDKDNEFKELFKYPFRHLDLIIKIESNEKFIFVKSQMINNDKLLMLSIFEKRKEKIYSVSFNFRNIVFEKDSIHLYGENFIDNRTISTRKMIFSGAILKFEDKYRQILESKDYIDSNDKCFEITACSHNENVFILKEDQYDHWSCVYMNDKEINSFVIMPYFAERKEGIFYQNEEFEWYYNDVLLEDIKGNMPQFGTKYILDNVENRIFLYKLNEWFKCDKCNIKISKIENTCDFCKIKYCDDCEPDNIIINHCKTCNKSHCKKISQYDEYQYCQKNNSNTNKCENCGF
jgi:hypothetical protein